MQSDSIFCKGFTHLICQDYTIHTDRFIAISDGCSSSPKTDIGARLVCESAKSNEAYKNPMFTMPPVLSTCANFLNLPEESLDATFLCAYVSGNNVVIKIYGDGVCCIKTKHGITHVLSLEYSESMPCYLSYFVNPDRRSRWKEFQNNVFEVEYSKFSEFSQHFTIKDLDGRFYKDSFIADCWYKFTPTESVVSISKDVVEWVALLSDGVRSFYKPSKTETGHSIKAVPYVDVIRILLDVKSFNGSFVQRRYNRFQKEIEKRKWEHADDIAFAMMCL